MSRPRSLRPFRLAAPAGGAMLFAAGVFAQPRSSSVLETNSTPALAVTLQAGEYLGQQQVIRGIIASGTNTFMFVVPEGLRAAPSDEGRVVLTSRDGRCFLYIGIVG